MTCAHVLGLIDAGSFADYPPAHLDAAWLHARQCATCGPALEASAALTRDLAELLEPAPPTNVAAAVLARIAQIESAHSVPDAEAMPERRARSSTRDWSPWATAFGGVTATLAIALSMPPGGGVPTDVESARVGGIRAGLAMPATNTATLALTAGLLLYAAGLFGPRGDRGRPF